MKLKFWKDLSKEQKEKILKRVCAGAAVIFVVILLLLLMKCEGCSSASRRKIRDFSDGRGHNYGEKLNGAELFDNEYGEGEEDLERLDSEAEAAEKARKAEEEAKLVEEERARLAEQERLAAEKALQEQDMYVHQEH